jgi:hypothetical protein
MCGVVMLRGLGHGTAGCHLPATLGAVASRISLGDRCNQLVSCCHADPPHHCPASSFGGQQIR